MKQRETDLCMDHTGASMVRHFRVPLIIASRVEG